MGNGMQSWTPCPQMQECSGTIPLASAIVGAWSAPEPSLENIFLWVQNHSYHHIVREERQTLNEFMTLHTVPWACMQFHDLACSYISLHAVPWAWMQFHWVPQSSILLFLSSSQELCSACLLEHSVTLSVSPKSLLQTGTQTCTRA